MSSTRKIWKEMALLGDGDYHAIPQDGGRVIIIETPFDERIRIIQIDLNKTIIPYGDVAQQRAVEGKAKIYKAAGPVHIRRHVVLRKQVRQGQGHCHRRQRSGCRYRRRQKALKDVPDEELPATLQAMNPKQRQQYLDERRPSASDFRRNSRSLSATGSYLRKKEKESTPAAGDSFDHSVPKMLEKQIR